jgi:hypothetical protein
MANSRERNEAFEARQAEQGIVRLGFSALNCYMSAILKVHRNQVSNGANNIPKSHVNLFLVIG